MEFVVDNEHIHMDLSKVGNFEYFYFVCGEKMGLLGNGIFAWVRSTLPALVRWKRIRCWLSSVSPN